MRRTAPGSLRGKPTSGSKTKQYNEKRDFQRSPEPPPDARREPGASLFVIQKHDASSLHYDFRLEVNGTLKSWAVPKGPSTDPRERRLAIATENHPLDYADFEGVIAEDQYGGGTVMIWDRGSYRNITEKDGGLRDMSDALAEGHALVWLEGEKLSGGYALQRIDKAKDRWLLIKMEDDEADARRNPVSTEPRSVASERDLDQILRREGQDSG